MTSRREATASQRGERFETLKSRTRGVNLGIHATTLAHVQNLLVDNLLAAEAEKARSFTLKSEGVRWCHSDQDAMVFRTYFQRCLADVWNVTFRAANGYYVFVFVRS